MSVLSSLLARDQVVPVKKIEEAIQRQVISGGELPTVLLEVAAAAENVITSYHAAAIGLQPASRLEVMNVAEDTHRLLSRALAEEHGVVVIDVEANTLIIACADAPSDASLGSLAQATGRRIVVRISTEPRIAAAMQSFYGVVPIPRMRRLITKLTAQDPGELTAVAPLVDNRFDRLSSVPPVTVSGQPNAVSSWMRAATAGEPAGGDSANVGANVRGSRGSASASKASSTIAAPVVMVAGAKVVGRPSAGSRDAGSGASGSGRGYGHGRKATEVGFASTGESTPEPSQIAAAAPVASSNEPSIAEVAAAALATPTPTNRPVVAERISAPVLFERPLTEDEAVAELATADSRGAILAIAFAHLRTHFDYCAIFSARDDEAEGLDAHGPGASPEQVREITLDLTRSGTARDVRDLLGAKAGVLDATEADRDLVQRLDRTAKQPSVLVPVAIRQRLVLLIYGDRGGESVGVGDLGEVMSFLQRVSDALQRLILSRKRGSGRSNQPGAHPWVKAAASLPSGAATTDERASDPGLDASAGSDASAATNASAADEPADELAARTPSSDTAERPAEFDLLRVPRKAPLPPDVTGVRSAPVQPEPHAARPTQDASIPAARRPSVIPGKPTENSTYRGVGGEEEVVLTRRKARRSQRPSAHPAKLESDRPEGPETPPAPTTTPSTPPVVVPPAARVPYDAGRSSDANDNDTDDDEPSIEMPVAAPVIETDATIITELGLDLDDLVDELVATWRDSPAAAESKINDLVGFGEPALRVLARRFPGPLASAARPGPEGPHPKARDASVVIAAMVAFRHMAVPHVVGLLDHRDADVRYYATLLAGEVLHRDLVVRIGRRVLDEDASVRAVATSVLRGARRFDAELAEVLAHFRRVGGNDRAPTTLRRLAVELLGELRDGDAVNVLVDVLGENDADLQRVAYRALVSITKQDLGSSASAWESWVARAGDHHRIEWLIDAITADDDVLRREAGEELKNLTKEYFGFQSALPRKELEVVQRKYRRWWDNIGKARFARA